MSYTIGISEDRSYIIVTVEGELDSETALNYTIQSHLLAREMGIKKFFIDLRDAVNTQSVIENYDFANFDLNETSVIDRRAKVAMLVSPDDHSHDFVEAVARSNGHNVRLFRVMDSALAYLME